MDEGTSMNKKIAEAKARLNDRLSHFSPVQIWVAGACDAVLTLLVLGGILAAIVMGGK